VWVIAFTLLVVIGLVAIYHFRDSTELSPVQIKHQAEQREKSRMPVPLRSVLEDAAFAAEDQTPADVSDSQSPIGRQGKTDLSSSQSDGKVSDPCERELRLIAERSLTELEGLIEDGNFALSEACARAMSEAARLPETRFFLAHCQRPQELSPATLSACVSTASAFRSMVLSEMYIGEQNLQDAPSAALANILVRNFASPASLDEAKLRQSIVASEALINRDDDYYEAYKSKLFSLLLLQTKYGVQINEDEYASLIDNLTAFQFIDDNELSRIEEQRATLEDELVALNEELDDLAARRAELADELSEMTDTPEADSELYLDLLAEENRLALEQSVLEAMFEDVQADLEATVFAEEQAIDPDIVRAMFLRFVAMGDTAALIDEAEDFIDRYPDSPLGYYFLALGLQQSGDAEDAFAVLNGALDEGVGNRLLFEMLQNNAEQQPINMIENLATNIWID
jgi:hypothetical protein